MLDKLERKYGRYALANLPMLLVAGQVAVFILAAFKPALAAYLVLIPERVLQGEVWRVVTFVFIPPVGLDVHALASGMGPTIGVFTLIILFFEMNLQLVFGRSIESHWGPFRFNVFIGVSWVATVAASFAFPGSVATNQIMIASVFLTFAYLVPDFELLLMFFIPVKIKWLGYLGWAYLGYLLLVGSWSVRLLVLAGVSNFFLFCGKDIALRLRGARRRGAARHQARVDALTPTHRCEVCGVTDLDDKTIQFRYCSRCEGKHAYCDKHLRDHEHILS